MHVLRIWMVGALFFAPVGLYAAEPDCRSIRDAEERLACYDRVFPVLEEEEPAVGSVVEPVADAEPVVAPTVEPEPIATRRPATARGVPEARPVPEVESEPEPAVTQSAAPEVERERRRLRLFGRRPERQPESDLAEVTASITAMTKTWPSGRWQYTLDNGQVWVQTRAKTTSVGVGDEVRIKKRSWTYYLLSRDGASFGVERTD